MKILIAKEKHGTRYFKADGEDLEKSAHKLLKERFEAGYWYENPEYPELKPEVSEEVYATLSEELKGFENRFRKSNKNDLQEYEKDVEFYNAVKSEVENPAGNAWKLLRSRRDYQYESVEIVELE